MGNAQANQTASQSGVCSQISTAPMSTSAAANSASPKTSSATRASRPAPHWWTTHSAAMSVRPRASVKVAPASRDANSHGKPTVITLCRKIGAVWARRVLIQPKSVTTIASPVKTNAGTPNAEATSSVTTTVGKAMRNRTGSVSPVLRPNRCAAGESGAR